jgi:GNAT superfamily N-acetyltransferase
MSPEQIEIKEFEPGDAAWIAARHGALYGAHDGFDASFEPLVARILTEFVASHDATRERGWVAWQGDARVGCIFCVALSDETAKLRLFLVEPATRGTGLGRRLLDTCMRFATDTGYNEMTLWTHESHKAACTLYARTGFRCVASTQVHSFGQDLVEQTWTRLLP